MQVRAVLIQIMAEEPDNRVCSAYFKLLHRQAGLSTEKKHLTSLRCSCPTCHGVLTIREHRAMVAVGEGGAHAIRKTVEGVNATIVAEPEAYAVAHSAKICPRCWKGSAQRVKYWHGYYETMVGTEEERWQKRLDKDFLPDSVWMVTKSFGIHQNWARKWRIRLYSHRSSFIGEGYIMKALQPSLLPGELDNMLLTGWVRWQVWQRACEAGAQVMQVVADQVLNMATEELLSSIMHWYLPLMKGHRLVAWKMSGDRLDIICIDGNAKLYRRTCGAPCAETVFFEALQLYLVRGCPESPAQKGVLCAAHATLRSQPELTGVIAKHRMVQHLAELPFLELQVQLTGFAAIWQPAGTMNSDVLQAYFAKQGEEVIEARRRKRAEQREQARRPVKERFLGDWSSKAVKTKCVCKTHKESIAAVRTASRSAGFLMAVTESGIIPGLAEIITAETLSQRYAFLAEMAEAEPELTGLVHDDACHVRVFAKTHRREDNEMSKRLSSEAFYYIVDRPHSRGHVDATCKAECFPTVAKNAAFLGDFPTPICESVNSELSPLAHTVHHMQRWLCLFIVSESVQVHNELRAQRRQEAQQRGDRKRAREAKASSSA